MMTTASKFSMKKIETVFAVSLKVYHLFYEYEYHVPSYAMKMAMENWTTKSSLRYFLDIETGIHKVSIQRKCQIAKLDRQEEVTRLEESLLSEEELAKKRAKEKAEWEKKHTRRKIKIRCKQICVIVIEFCW